MKDYFSIDALLQTAPPMNSGSLASMALPIVMMFAIFYFLLIRPQNKERKQHKTMIENLKKGDKVQTIGGIIATIVKVKDATCLLKIDENSTLEIKKESISTVINLEKKKVDANKKGDKEENKDQEDNKANDEKLKLEEGDEEASKSESQKTVKND